MEPITLAVGAIIAIFFFFIGFCLEKGSCNCPSSWEIAMSKMEYEKRKLDNEYYNYKHSFRYQIDLQHEYQRGYAKAIEKFNFKPKTPNEQTVADLLTTSMKTTKQIAKELDLKV